MGLVSAASFVAVLPVLIVRRNPERMLEVLLPPFDILARAVAQAGEAGAAGPDQGADLGRGQRRRLVDHPGAPGGGHVHQPVHGVDDGGHPRRPRRHHQHLAHAGQHLRLGVQDQVEERGGDPHRRHAGVAVLVGPAKLPVDQPEGEAAVQIGP